MRSRPREVRWERMFPDELEAAFETCPAVYFSYGLCEPHGPQNAVGLDALKAHAVACKAARLYGGIAAPPDYWHIHELGGYANWGHDSVGQAERNWMTSVPPWMHFKSVCYQIRAADALGFRAAILLTGHYGPNWQDLKTLTELAQPYASVRLYSLPDFEANQPGMGGAAGDHAGKVETSLLWALEPDCVDMSRMPDRGEPGPHFAMGPNAYEADRRIGERMAEDEARFLGEKMQELLQAYEEAQPTRRLRTFEDVERLWEEAVRPRLGEFLTMNGPPNQEAPPESSVWAANAPIPKRGW